MAPADSAPAWRLALAAPERRHLAAFEAVLVELGFAVTSGTRASRGAWRLTAYAAAPPDAARLEAHLAAAAAGAGIDPPELHLEEVAAKDWVADYRSRIGPVRIGRFFLYPSHYSGAVPPGAVAIRLDAGLAFGTGEHASTQGCLHAFDRLAAAGRRVGSMLDMGSGSGILAIAAAKLWRARVLACDNDAVAVEVTARNARINRVAARFSATRGEGYAAPGIARRAPFDLIAANIEARPLMDMAPDLARHLAPSGAAVLSGLLAAQAAAVADAHEKHGLAVADRIRLGEWETLVLAWASDRTERVSA